MNSVPRRLFVRLAISVTVLMLGLFLAVSGALPDSPAAWAVLATIGAGAALGIGMLVRATASAKAAAVKPRTKGNTGNIKGDPQDWLIALVLLGGWLLLRPVLGDATLVYLLLFGGTAATVEKLRPDSPRPLSWFTPGLDLWTTA